MTPAGEVLARVRHNRPALVGLYLVAALVLFALAGPLAARWDPDASDFSLTHGAFGPSAAHWLGTDLLFRDMFARLAAGARVSLFIGVAASSLATGIGAAVGVVAGMAEGTRFGIVDTLAMRCVDVLLALPFLLFVTAIGMALDRTDMGTVLLVLGCTGWTGTARIVRARTLQVRALDYVAAARALGAGPVRVALRHVLPGLAGVLVVIASTGVATMILAEAVLGYLTVGLPPPHATWGRMLHEGEQMVSARLALAAFPGFAILLSVLGWNRLGDGIADALAGGGRDRDLARAAAARKTGLPVDLLLAGAALLLVSFARPGAVVPPLGAPSGRDTPQRGGVFHGATFVNLRTLDPALAFDEGSIPLLQLVFARLVTWDAAGHVVGDLASTVSVSPDGKTYTFEIRPGARFHDGSPVQARDVQRSLERLLHPRTPSPAASLYASIQGYASFHAGRAEHLAGVRVLGERLLAIDLDAPDATFLPKMTMGFAAPVCASSGAWADTHGHALPCGAGPFRVASWEPDHAVHLVRHEGYHDPALPYLDGFEWSLNVPVTTQRYKLERGELDYVAELSSADRDLFAASPAWQPYGRWTALPRTNAVFLNTEAPPFDRREIRRAVAFALDPEAVARMRSDVIAADRVIPPGIPGPARTEPMRRHDLPAALAAMARAGFPFDPATGEGGWPWPIDYLTIPDTGDQQLAEVWQQQLARVGLRVRLKLVTFASFLAESQRRHTAQMGRAGWSADYPDPSNFFEPILASAAIQDEGSDNVSFFSDPELDDVLARAHGEPDAARRNALYLRAEEIVRDEAPWIPTHGSQVYELWQPHVRGYAPNPVLRQRFVEVWLDRGGSKGAALAFLVPRGVR